LQPFERRADPPRRTSYLNTEGIYLAQENKKTMCQVRQHLTGFPRREGERMDKVASARINNFGPALKADVQPAEESVFVLTSNQLKEIIAQAVKEAIQPLQEEMAALRSRLAELETLQEQDTTRICLDIAYDRRRLAALEKVEPGPTDEERKEKLEIYLKDKKVAGLKPEASFSEARAYLELSRSQFSKLVSKLGPRDFVVFPHPLNYKAKMIGLAHKM